MSYPTLEQYTNVMQHPELVLADPDLKNGKIAKSGLGLPLALCGGFALTYTITSRGKKYAVRCFHKQSNHLEARYKAISNQLKALRSAYFVDFEFQPTGVTVDRQKYPIVKMTWASGKTLGEFMAGNYHKKDFLQELNKSLLSLAGYLEKEQIAHGDIQPGNVMVANEGRSIQLIDYDGMFVGDLKNLGGTELGLVNFQHPRRNSFDWDFRLDRFSFILLNFAFRVLEAHPDLWDKTQSDENAILFKAQDFADPGNSGIFQKLVTDSQFKDDARNFASICKASFDKIPTPDEFLAGRNIPQVAVTISPTGKITRTGYLGAYPVLDAANYELCLQYVGDRVELIGCSTDIKPGTTRYGSPYIFLNFGHWVGKIAKITIWSEGLKALSKKPDESWTGKWISVVGLMEPPYQTSRYSHLSITITQDNQLHEISEVEARYRLSGGHASTSVSIAGNKEILDSIREAGSLPSTSRSLTPTTTPAQPRTQSAPSMPSSSVSPRPTSKKTAPKTPNQAVLSNMKSSYSQPVPAVSTVKAQTPKAKTQQPKPIRQKKTSLSAWLIYAGIALALLYFLPILFGSQSSSKSTAVPTRKPIATATSKPPRSVPVVPATEKVKCISWTEVNKSLDGKVQCVYGIVTSKRTFKNNDGEFFYMLIRFSDDVDSFYLTSHDEPLVAFAGDCVSAEAVISYDANKVPFIETSEITIDEYSCSK